MTNSSDPFKEDPRYRVSEWNWAPVDNHSPLVTGPGTNAEPASALGGVLVIAVIVGIIDQVTGGNIVRLIAALC